MYISVKISNSVAVYYLLNISLKNHFKHNKFEERTLLIYRSQIYHDLSISWRKEKKKMLCDAVLLWRQKRVKFSVEVASFLIARELASSEKNPEFDSRSVKVGGKAKACGKSIITKLNDQHEVRASKCRAGAWERVRRVNCGNATRLTSRSDFSRFRVRVFFFSLNHGSFFFRLVFNAEVTRVSIFVIIKTKESFCFSLTVVRACTMHTARKKNR